jgi:choice-of-anchor C domain-containing protein
MRRHFVPVALALALAAPPAARAQIVQNGSFEPAGGTCTGSFTTHGVGNPAISPWAITAGTIDLICTFWQHDQGVRSLDMNGTSAATISQTVTLLPGSTYQLSFAMAGNPDTGADLKTMEVSVGTAFLENFSFNAATTSRTNMGWVTHTRTFVADATNPSLQFRSTMAGSGGPALDDVSIVLVPSAVPEPSTVALVSGGLLALAGFARRRRA